jgi:hypothetical protein
MHSVSAHMTFANTSLKTPLSSSSPVSTPSILQTNQEHQNNNVALSDLSPPKLLNSFQQQQPDINSDNGNEENYVVDIPDANYDTNNNNDGGNSNIILNVDPSVQSSPTGSQVGNM